MIKKPLQFKPSSVCHLYQGFGNRCIFFALAIGYLLSLWEFYGFMGSLSLGASQQQWYSMGVTNLDLPWTHILGFFDRAPGFFLVMGGGEYFFLSLIVAGILFKGGYLFFQFFLSTEIVYTVPSKILACLPSEI